jgi:ZIP family zinc transporter
MTVWAALFWGAFTSASLYLGEALAGPMRDRERATGLVMAFGAGTMLSAVAYELVPVSSLSHGWGVGIGLTLGSLAYFIGDRIVDGAGGEKRQEIAGTTAAEGSGAAMFVGALLDGVPEAFILGTTIALGGQVSIAFVAAVFI